MSKSRKKDAQSKKHKRTFTVILMIMVSVVLIMAVIYGFWFLYKAYKASFYPEDVLQHETLISPHLMEADAFANLGDIAETVSKSGYAIYPTEDEQQFNYDLDLYAKIGTSISSDGYLYIARGSGDIQADICSYINDYYPFTGSVTPVYKDVRYEEGYENGYQAVYSAGTLNASNFFKKNDFHVTAIEYLVKSDLYTVFIYVSTDITDMQGSVALIKNVAQAAFVGCRTDSDSAGNNASVENRTGQEIAETEVSEETASETAQPDNGVSESAGISTDINAGIDTWAQEYAKSGGVGDGTAPNFRVDGDITTYDITSKIDKDGYPEVVFIAQASKGTPIRAVLFNPSMNAYYEPSRYNEADGKYYFYVQNPEQGIWRCALQLSGETEFCTLIWHEITTDEERDLYLNGPAPVQIDEEAFENGEDFRLDRASDTGVELELQ